MKVRKVFTILGIFVCIIFLFTTCGENNPVNGNQVKPLKTGEWTATADFGGFDFTVNSEGTEISEIRYNFSEWTCGGVTVSGGINISRIPGWPIADRKFTIENDLDAQGNQTKTING